MRCQVGDPVYVVMVDSAGPDRRYGHITGIPATGQFVRVRLTGKAVARPYPLGVVCDAASETPLSELKHTLF